jgi:hypothetical protein
MKLPRRNFLHLAAGAAALPFAPHVRRGRCALLLLILREAGQMLSYVCCASHCLNVLGNHFL